MIVESRTRKQSGYRKSGVRGLRKASGINIVREEMEKSIGNLTQGRLLRYRR